MNLFFANGIIVITVFLAAFAHSLSALADLSLLVIDLKYNQRQGVKICEMQPASFSRFSGSDLLEEENAIPKQYCAILEQYRLPIYFTHPLYKKMKQAFIERGGSSVRSAEELSKNLSPAPPLDPDNLFDYQCCLFSLDPEPILQADPLRFPQILFLDRAILPYCRNKYITNYLLDQIEETKQLRPVWHVYRKESSQTLIEQIHSEIPSEIIVIKPIQSTMGRGVIILEKKDLQATLSYIFNSPKQILINDLERSYSHYAIDRSNFFIVEEFIPSDPLLFGDPPLPYDCTMRVVALLCYHQKIPSLSFLSAYWYSPRYPIEPGYSLIQSHKAKGTHVSAVAPEVLHQVQNELSPAFLKAYQYMLDRYHAYIKHNP